MEAIVLSLLIMHLILQPPPLQQEVILIAYADTFLRFLNLDTFISKMKLYSNNQKFFRTQSLNLLFLKLDNKLSILI